MKKYEIVFINGLKIIHEGPILFFGEPLRKDIENIIMINPDEILYIKNLTCPPLKDDCE